MGVCIGGMAQSEWTCVRTDEAMVDWQGFEEPDQVCVVNLESNQPATEGLV